MFVAPVLVICSLFIGERMPLIFSMPELVSMVTSVFLTIAIMNDGDTNWFEGLTLLAAYFIMGIGFYFEGGSS
jgi:Ca2+:H+ antiporter